MTTDLWKDIYKKVLTGYEKIFDKDLNNSPGYDHLSKIATSLMGRLKLMFIIELSFNSVISHLLDVLPFGRDCKTICDHIYQSLPLNQL